MVLPITMLYNNINAIYCSTEDYEISTGLELQVSYSEQEEIKKQDLLQHDQLISTRCYPA